MSESPPAADATTEAVERFLTRWLPSPAAPSAPTTSFSSPTSAPCLKFRQTPAGQRRHPRQRLRLRAPRTSFTTATAAPATASSTATGAAAFIGEAKKIRPPTPPPASSTTPCSVPVVRPTLRPGPGGDEGRRPFLVVLDVGHAIELYAEFTRSGGTYVPFPDPRCHRTRLDHRATPESAPASQVWLDPLRPDPARRSARVTREIAGDSPARPFA